MSARTRSTRASTAASTMASESLADTNMEYKTKGDTRKATSASSAKPLRGSELKRLRKLALFAMIVAFAYMGGIFYAVKNDIIRIHPNAITANSLKGFNSRAEFTLRYQVLLMLWLVFNVLAVLYVRISKLALNPLVDSTEKHVAGIKNILTNSYEQIFLSCILQLAFASFAESHLVVRFIPAFNIVQFIGRVAFFLGYPYYRTFGFVTTMFPNLVLLGYNLYSFGSFMLLY